MPSPKKPRTYRRNLPRPPNSPPTRQHTWQLKKIQENHCTICGKDKGDSEYRFYCMGCGVKQRIRARKKKKYKPWRPGGPGRPPFQIKEEEDDLQLPRYVGDIEEIDSSITDLNSTNEGEK